MLVAMPCASSQLCRCNGTGSFKSWYDRERSSPSVSVKKSSSNALKSEYCIHHACFVHRRRFKPHAQAQAHAQARGDKRARVLGMLQDKLLDEIYDEQENVNAKEVEKKKESMAEEVQQQAQ